MGLTGERYPLPVGRACMIIIFMLAHHLDANAAGHQFECAHASRQVVLPVSTHVSDSGLLDYDVNYYGLRLEVNDTNTFIRGHTVVRASAVQALNEVVLELSGQLRIDSLWFNGMRMGSFEHIGNLIRFETEASLPEGTAIEVVVYYHGNAGSGGFFSGISNRIYAPLGRQITYTLSEPFKALDWFACKQVLTDKADSADITLLTGPGVMAGSNGLLVTVDSLPDGQIAWRWQSRYPIAYYLISLSVASYREFSYRVALPGRQDSLLVQNFIYNDAQYLADHQQAILETGDMLHSFSRQFGIYPFANEKYGHCVAPMGGGMEHQTMTTLSDFSFTLVAHELAHQWFGNHVTCATWQDIWINEGFASYAEYLALESLRGQPEASAWMDQAHRFARSRPGGSVYVPLEEARNPGRIFDGALSYKKGAALLHMIRYELADDSLFLDVLREFQNRHGSGVATGDDFNQVLNDVSGASFDWFFEQWYYGKGHPNFQFTWGQLGDSLQINISQQGSSDQTPFFRTSYAFRLNYKDGSDTLVGVFIDQQPMTIMIPVKGQVSSIEPDPENWILEQYQLLQLDPGAAEGRMMVQPNPFDERLNIQFLNGAARRTILLTDLSGKLMNQTTSHDNLVRLNTRQLASGVYILRVEERGTSYALRVIRR